MTTILVIVSSVIIVLGFVWVGADRLRSRKAANGQASTQASSPVAPGPAVKMPRRRAPAPRIGKTPWGEARDS